MKYLAAFSGTLLGLIALGTGANMVSAQDIPTPQEIQFVAAQELDYEGELKNAIVSIAYLDEYSILATADALQLGKTLSEIGGSPGRNSQVAAALCAIYNNSVGEDKQNYFTYYNALTNLTTLGESMGSEYAGDIANAIKAAAEADRDGFILYVKGVAAVTQECQKS